DVLDDLAALDERGDVHADAGATVTRGDDRVLHDVHEAPGEVPGVRGLQRGVREALSSAVGRDEVLQDGQALAEVRRDRGLDDLAGGLGHQAAHAGQLPDLRGGATGAGVDHHPDRVERVVVDHVAILVLDL